MNLADKELEAVKKGRAFATIMRPQNSRFSILLFVCASLRLGNQWSQILAGAIMIFLCYATVTIWNDIVDVQVDIANQRRLPLALGLLTIKEAKLLSTAFFIGALLSIYWLHLWGFIYMLVTLLLGALYSFPPFVIEKRGLLATLLLGICYATLPLLLSLSTHHMYDVHIYLVIFASIPLTMALLLYKDYKDQDGDELFRKITPLIKYGSKKIKVFSSCFLLVGALILLSTGILSWQLFGILVAGVALYLLQRSTPKVNGIFSTLYVIGITFALVSGI